MTYPEKNELVVCKITRITDTGAYAELPEYDKKGFIHISNVSSSWVKNIRSHLTKGEIKVANVIRINEEKELIDLSLKKVTKTQEEAKLNEWKKTKRADKLIEIASERAEKDPEEVRGKLGEEVYSLLEKATVKGKEALEDKDIDEETKEEIVNIAEENITKPEVSIKTKINLKVSGPAGVEKAKKILKQGKTENTRITYMSSPNYKMKTTGKDYKDAEKKLSEAKEKMKELADQEGAECSLERMD